MPMSTLFARCLVGAACLGAALSAQAALPTVTMTFDQPTGVVGATDSIDVWITLTVDATGSALSFDASAGEPFGFAQADLPTQGFHNDSESYGNEPADFASYNYVQTNTYFGCSGSFTNVCSPGAYAFNFHLSSEPTRPSFNFQSALNLQPGESTSYLFGSFTPNGGPVAAGTYTFYSSGATLLFQGQDADGHDLYSYVTMGDTCSSQEAACAFTRTVVAVPEPQSYALMALGLLGIAGVSRRRRAR